VNLSGAEVFERAMAELLRSSHLLAPDQLPDAVAGHMQPIGVLQAVIYLVDLQQGWLRPIPTCQAPDRTDLSIDGTLAGLAFRHGRTQISETDEGRPRLLLPLFDGSERLGVLELIVEHADERTMPRYRSLASLVGLLIVSKSAYSDTYAQTRRVRPMKLKAEMEWAFMPPLSFATDEVMINAAVEPAYEVGGDAFDYSLVNGRLQVSLFDACGHDLAAGIAASVAMATCRNARRSGQSLDEMAATADCVIYDQFGPRRFVTALLCDLDVRTGRFSWIPCGHPPPLLIRRSKATELSRPPRPPLGIAPEDSRRWLQQQQLQPRDRVLLYTDGVTEARNAEGDEFGKQRLIDFINQHGSEGMPTAEALRRLTRAVLAHHHGRLSDDVAIVQLQWQPDRPDQFGA
jgi:hypothetical protein